MTLSTLFLICFLVGLGVSAVSLFSSFLHLHHGGFHFHHHGGGGHSLVKNGSELFGSLFNLAAITIFLAWFGGVGCFEQKVGGAQTRRSSPPVAGGPAVLRLPAVGRRATLLSVYSARRRYRGGPGPR